MEAEKRPRSLRELSQKGDLQNGGFLKSSVSSCLVQLLGGGGKKNSVLILFSCGGASKEEVFRFFSSGISAGRVRREAVLLRPLWYDRNWVFDPKQREEGKEIHLRA